jgi:crooked neck
VRARSVYERALEVDFKHVATWVRYAEMETRAKFVNRARNVLDRAVGLLPRVDALWLPAVLLEETLGDAARYAGDLAFPRFTGPA